MPTETAAADDCLAPAEPGPVAAPSRERRPSRTTFILAFAAIYLIWGSTYLGIRVAVGSIPAFVMASVRFLVAGSVLLTILRLRGVPWPTPRQWAQNGLAGVALLLGGNALVGWAEQKVPSGLTTLVIGASPFMMVFLDWWRPGGTRPARGVWLGIAVGLSGIVLLLGPGAFPAGQRPDSLSVAALLVSALCWCVGSLYSKHIHDNAEPMIAAAVQMLAGSASSLATAGLTGEIRGFSWSAVSGSSVLALVYLIIAGSLIAYPTYVWLLKHTTAARVSTYAYVNPVVAVFLGWAVLGEPLIGRMLLAGAVIVAAVAIITVQRSRARPG